ncbi:thioesterase family protein [Pseudomonas capeferrum]|uniref:acyl-CoA thioesterase n=1 Tax=Pseudomonas capeferrum TaxID=1495066 RepID=UPI0015E3A697|nr:thioesterase family protein [Pseudomonas capeferrum]MBA1202014.1 thioesterase family protein [Pseudomonas capeferrum]
MNFNALLDAVRRQPEAVSVSATWTQGRAIFGGLMAALLYEAMREQVQTDRPVRSLAITFVGPAAADTPIAFEVEVLREGKAVSTLLGRALQNGQVVTLMQGSFGSGRASLVEVPALPPVDLPALDQSGPELPYVKGVTPEFIRHVGLRWAVGGMPFSNSSARRMGGWVHLRDAMDEPLDEAHLIALVDSWPSTLMSYLRQPAAGSTLTWTLDFIQPLGHRSASAWYQYCAQTEHAHAGYGQASAGLWADDGTLLALSRQTVTVFA